MTALALALLSGGAWAQDEVCESPPLADPGDTLSVAWVSPLRKRARGKAWLYVVPTAELRTFAAGEARGDVARLLQWAGIRRSSRPPTRRFKVVVFDVGADRLCRPVVPEDGALVQGRLAGVSPCDEGQAGEHGKYEGCGWITDLATGRPSVEAFRAQWNDLAANGFCLLPLERFVAQPE
jgi:hypothetical protein